VSFTSDDVSLPQLLTATEAADYLSVSLQTLNGWRCKGNQALPYVKVGSLVRYKLADLAAFVEKQTESGGDQ
jgi:excisionase family DNA binding protein